MHINYYIQQCIPQAVGYVPPPHASTCIIGSYQRESVGLAYRFATHVPAFIFIMDMAGYNGYMNLLSASNFLRNVSKYFYPTEGS